ncbi:basic secretory protein-like protein [Chryseolinea lacunae]|uniref:Secretory protein n=1 Tax=Chryseolinea lacunae TaxID=2801331 RepID=A0ABS1KU82_9BACT|nr:basic secretory protein-like protein [Chryseolinea lacunae]MBL0742991.1 secretory protein [Chryseolinea lacunae]
MNKVVWLGYLLLTLCPLFVAAQGDEVLERKGFSLTFISNDSTLDGRLRARMIKTFFELYPVLAKEYNVNACRAVVFQVDTAYHGVGEAYGCVTHYGAQWLHHYASDIDIVTHEIMHVIQDYPKYEPLWITEGIADYVRYTFGVDNAGAGWSLPPFKAGQHYSHGYRVTARFFVWLEQNIRPGIVKAIDAAMRAGTYSEKTWRDETNRTVDDLWLEYETSNPVFSVHKN